MLSNIQLENDAIKELHSAKCYFDTIEKGEDFLNQTDIILEMHYDFQIRYKNVRIIQLDKFFYSIHYTI